MLKILLGCGLFAPTLYVAADLVAAALYPGYSFTDQAVSELFAIGAPTSGLVVALFTVSSGLYAAFACGVWASAADGRALRVLAIMLALSAIDTLLLWNLFPMHMRGVTPTFTDTMHGALAINPFVPLGIVCGAVAFRGGFRWYSLATIVLLLAPAPLAFVYVPEVIAGQPTPWLGVVERVPQYGHHLWHAVLAMLLLRKN